MIVLHYFTTPRDYEHSPIFDSTMERLQELGLVGKNLDSNSEWRITNCGEAFVQLSLLHAPIPILKWVLPVAVASQKPTD